MRWARSRRMCCGSSWGRPLPERREVQTGGDADAAGSADAAVATSTAAGLDNSACPRCGGGFHCGVADGHCACFGLRLTDALKAQLSRDYPGQCLCLSCLSELSQRAPSSHPAPLATGADDPPRA